ncbi:hypothetical protein GLOIN_2v1483215 [Rhizophagus irregularis DAOM 181602=DAOM 197198]|uniref:Uncharacterized protein n=1 Tax=Rhizophagus irregularis (strain DAOM 181602 / DAOM 197198 / MUCL 43194) TaxID=747089 RepID=A0A2P4PIU9_RHIID|nr:hypothetical protein GLOIN_2v1483215 [Rhizophagus irregularis DAOM 181602=DAOM 197198]POG65321.1 hypothetical protein GLOIN_2v1483215 [Rhizophagus irregularis DAOM 181602=DAOM 197198]|eukprot:XP_025172187.1 hypothetical protein GLOIN_2v1483215 [Rhizophagus irregularis DAOM 181602=DAOM 197198]
MHKSFQKEVQKKIDDISEKIDQLMIPDDSYWKCHEVIKACRCDKAKDVRSAMFDIFGKKNLTRINTSAGVDDIRAFKNSKKTKQAFKCLFKADDDNNLPYVEAIKKKAWGKKNTTKKDTAFTLAICEIVLNPKHPKISSCICNSEEITSSTIKSIRQEKLGENYLNTSEESDGNESSGDNLDNNEDLDNSNEDNDDMINENQKRSREINNIDNQNHKYQRIDNNSLEISFN